MPLLSPYLSGCQVVYSAVKTCIATTSQTIRSFLSYSVRRIDFRPRPFSLTDNSNIVYAIFLIETLQTALSGADVYYWFVTGYGDIKHITSPHATPFDVPIIEAVVSSSVQFFFAFRIWLLSMKRSWCLSLIICLVSPS
jgi:hypothetical protein